MRVFYMANNLVGWRVAQWLQTQNAEVVGLALHPGLQQRYGSEIRASLGITPECEFDASRLNEQEELARLRALRPDIGLSVYFGTILRPNLLDSFTHGVVNLHPSYLPYNRGANPNVWSIIEGSPAGVTLHYIDRGIDTGDIIAQERVDVSSTDTGATLYRKLEQASIDLFQQTWPRISAGTCPRRRQPQAIGPTHRVRDLATVDEIELDRAYTARELIDLLRARTFAPHPGAYFKADDGSKIYLRLQLLSAADLEASSEQS